MFKNKALIIYGPTVTGKTALAIKLAKIYNGEIISVDSRQVYRGLDIGSGKVDFKSKVEKHTGYWIVDGIKIYGFDLVSPGKQFTVADFIKFATGSIISINKSKKLPILVGGTGFYIKSLLYGLESIGVKENKKLRGQLSKLSVYDLYKKLKEINPKKAQSMNESDKKNPRRLIRAIEIAGITHKQRTTNYKPPTINHLIIGLTAENNYIFKKADNWLEERLKRGLVTEVESLRHKLNSDWLISLGLEYKWVTLFLEGKTTKQEAIIRLKGDIHDFIRRQKTWLSQLKEIKVFNITNKLELESLEKTISLWYTQENERLQHTTEN